MKFAPVVMASLLALAVTLSNVSCSSPTTPKKVVKPHVYTVAWRDMIRDRQTVNSYLGKRVRFNLLAVDCSFEGSVIRVWHSDRNVPPVMVITSSNIPQGESPFVVEGTCESILFDDIWRGRAINYQITIENASVTPQRRP